MAPINHQSCPGPALYAQWYIITRSTPEPLIDDALKHHLACQLWGSRSGGGGTDRQVLLHGRSLLEDGVALEEVDRLEVEARGHGGHDGEVLLARDVMEPQRVPQHQVPVLDRTVPVRPYMPSPSHTIIIMFHELLADTVQCTSAQTNKQTCQPKWPVCPPLCSGTRTARLPIPRSCCRASPISGCW